MSKRPHCSYWIGLHKETPYRFEKTGWKWVDGQPYHDSMDHWGEYNPKGIDEEWKCGSMYMFGDNLKWSDNLCSWKLWCFICKQSECIY